MNYKLTVNTYMPELAVIIWCNYDNFEICKIIMPH
jgi:hypothetical protein